MNEIWCCIGSGNSWGKGETFTEALRNMFKNESRTYPSTQMHVYRFNLTNLKISDIEISEIDGGVSYPADPAMKMRKLARVEIPEALRKAFTAFDDEVDGFVNTTEFYTAFPFEE